MSRLSDVEIFVRVVDSGSFSAAARHLGVSKSHVSKRLTALEDALGARLLNRTTRRLGLTDVGSAFHARCSRALADLEEAELAVSMLQSEPRGLLRVSLPVTFGSMYVVPVVVEFMAAHPALQVDLRLSDRFVDIVDEGFDIAVRVGRPADSTLFARRLADVRRYVCASPDYFARHGVPDLPEALKHHRCLLYGDETSWTLMSPAGSSSVRVDGRLRADNGNALLDAAIAGQGLVLAPDFIIAEAVRRGELEVALCEWSTWGAAYAVYPHNRHLSAKVRLFVDELVRRLQPPPWAL